MKATLTLLSLFFIQLAYATPYPGSFAAKTILIGPFATTAPANLMVSGPAGSPFAVMSDNSNSTFYFGVIFSPYSAARLVVDNAFQLGANGWAGTKNIVMFSNGFTGMNNQLNPAYPLDLLGDFHNTGNILTGNITEINGVPYDWTVTQGNPGTVLTNDGAGILTWNPPFVGGSDTQILFNSGGVETGSADLAFVPGTLQLNNGAGIQITGNISEINTVSYVWPTSQGPINSVLSNDGGGNLTWVSTATVAVSSFTAVPQWHKYHFSYLDFITAPVYSSTETYVIPVTIPPGAFVHGVKIKQPNRFNVATTTYTISVGVLGNNTEFASAFQVTQATGPDVFEISENFDSINNDAPTPILVFADTTDTIGNAASGNVDIWLLISVPEESTPTE